jgi:hypothetical protein
MVEYLNANIWKSLKSTPIPGDTFEIIEGNRMRGTLGVQVGGKGNRGLEVHKGDGF